LGAIALAGTIHVPVIATAADLPTKAPVLKAPITPITSWTGFYVGIGAGFRSSETDVNVTSATDTTLPAAFGADPFRASGCLQGRACYRGLPFDGVTGRVSPYAGFNWQIWPRTVIGVEADAGFANQTTTLAGSYPATPFFSGRLSDSFSVKTEWDASVRARAGYLIEPWFLAYATGGASWLHVKSTSVCSTNLNADGACAVGGFPAFAPSVISHSDTKVGATVGGGIEALLWSNWIARAEYRFADYGTVSNRDVRNSVLGTQTVTYDVKLQTHTATFGVAYKFGGPFGDYASAAPTAYAAYAAYKAPPAARSWTGFYLGAELGVRASDTTATLTSATRFFDSGFVINPLENCRDCNLDDPFSGTAFHGGPYAGYNWQFASQLVAGIEGDFGFGQQKTTLFGNSGPGLAAFGASGTMADSYSIKTDWDASVRGRLGYLVTPTFLAYATGGVAFLRLEETSVCDTNARFVPTAPGFVIIEVGACAPGQRTPVQIKQSTIRTGFTVGAGLEAKLWSNWVARGEYRFADYGKANFASTRRCAGSTTISDPSIGTATINCFETDVSTRSVEVQTHSAMFGLAYLFDY